MQLTTVYQALEPVGEFAARVTMESEFTHQLLEAGGPLGWRSIFFRMTESESLSKIVGYVRLKS